jgi:hypothetical protein
MSSVADDVVDPRVFEQLAAELGSLESARRIAAIYLDLLDGRVARLAGACEAGDVEAAMDAALSLKVTSATIGAAAMRDCALDLEGCLRRGGCGGADDALQRVRGARAATAEAVARMTRPAPA